MNRLIILWYNICKKLFNKLCLITILNKQMERKFYCFNIKGMNLSIKFINLSVDNK